MIIQYNTMYVNTHRAPESSIIYFGLVYININMQKRYYFTYQHKQSCTLGECGNELKLRVMFKGDIFLSIVF